MALSTFADATTLALIAGLLMPPFVAVVQQPQWSTRTRSLVTAAVSLLVGLVIAWSQGAFASWQVTASTVVVVLVATNNTYRTLWAKIGATRLIESGTLVRGRHRREE